MQTTHSEPETKHAAVYAPLNGIAGRTPSLIIFIIFLFAIGQFVIFTWTTLDQPIIDLWGFRPAQTASPVSYFLREGRWFAPVVPIFGEPWVVPIEFPFYQWCVALLVWMTGAPVDSCGRLISAFFAVATLWPIDLLVKSAALDRRTTLLVGALWLLAPVVVFFGRSFLIETTVVFLSASWLAFYVRLLASGRAVAFVICLAFGTLAALVKITGFAGFLVVGFVHTCVYVWRRRESLSENVLPLLFAGSTIFLAAVALALWLSYADGFMTQNPLAALLRSEGLSGWYLGLWSDRWSMPLWEWTIRLRALPQALGVAWFVVLYGLVRMGWRNRLFWLALTLLAGYLSEFLFFPKLHINHFYYQVENAILLCAAAAIIIEALVLSGRAIEAYLVLLLVVGGQLWTFYTGSYFKILTDDLHKHPYYQAGLVVRDTTPPDSVIVVFGTGYGADLPYFADRRGVVLANWFPIPILRKVVFDERDHWFGGRKLGAVVDCAVYENQAIGSDLIPIRDELKRELSGNTKEVVGSFYGAQMNPSKCQIFFPRE